MTRRLPEGTSCYACEGAASSWEHAPPRGFYPVGKNRQGKDYRNGLIVVPSCPEHNNEKSKDDLYTMTMIGTVAAAYASAFGPNPDPFTRSLHKRLHGGPRLRTTIASGKDVTVAGAEFIALTPDMGAIARVLRLLARALYFHEHQGKKKWTNECVLFCTHSAFYLDDPSDDESFLASGARALESRLGQDNEPLKGPHPNIFGYQLLEPTPGQAALRMVFYGTVGFMALRTGR